MEVQDSREINQLVNLLRLGIEEKKNTQESLTPVNNKTSDIETDEIQKLLCVSNPILSSPIQKLKEKDKTLYFLALEKMQQEYSTDERYSIALLEVYRKIICPINNVFPQKALDFGLDELLSKITKVRHKWFRRYWIDVYFLIDTLYLVAFNDENKAKLISERITNKCHKKEIKRIQSVIGSLYGNSTVEHLTETEKIYYSSLKRNREFYFTPPKRVIITATMSSGKSSLVNAVVGKSVSKTMNEACTAKIHHIISKPCEDSFSSEFDADLVLNANSDILMEDNVKNISNTISVGTYFRLCEKGSKRVELIDTPGVGSYWNSEHELLAKEALSASNFDSIVCVLDSGALGINNTFSHISSLLPYQDKYRIIFLINKTDTYNTTEDSIENSVLAAKADIESIGFSNFDVYPISARAGYLAKLALYGEKMSEDDLIDLEKYQRIYKRDFYDCSKYYPTAPNDYQAKWSDIQPEKAKDYLNILVKSGLLGFESLIF